MYRCTNYVQCGVNTICLQFKSNAKWHSKIFAVQAREKAAKEMSECVIKHDNQVETMRTQYQENIQSLKQKAFDDAQKVTAHHHQV